MDKKIKLKFSIIIPVYNEINTIKKLLTKIKQINIDNCEWILVDDGSIDGTTDILRKIRSRNNIKAIFINMNKGRGNAIIRGIKKASGDVILFFDADFETEITLIKKFLQEIEKGSQVVYGSKFLNKKNKFGLIQHIGNYLLNKLANLLYNKDITDIATGYVAVRKNILKKIKLSRLDFTFDIELTVKLWENNVEIKEIPINYKPRKYKEDKKINYLIDGPKLFGFLIYYKIKQLLCNFIKFF